VPPFSDNTISGPLNPPRCEAIIRLGLFGSTANTPMTRSPASALAAKFRPGLFPDTSTLFLCRSLSQPPFFTNNVVVPPLTDFCNPQGAPGELAAPSCVHTTGEAPHSR